MERNMCCIPFSYDLFLGGYNESTLFSDNPDSLGLSCISCCFVVYDLIVSNIVSIAFRIRITIYIYIYIYSGSRVDICLLGIYIYTCVCFMD